MASFKYLFGDVNKIEQLFPPAEYANSTLKFTDYTDVIKHYTYNSLKADGLAGITENDVTVTVTKSDGKYYIELAGKELKKELETFGKRHAKVFSKKYAQKAIRGMELLKKLGIWNPMEGFRVNHSPTDGICKWHLFPPLGLNLVNQKSILLMHYPPWQALQEGDSLNCMTLDRWGTILSAVGIPHEEVSLYKTVVDVNPVSAPGSGQSEYPNDYLPIMMASGFFDGGPDRNYIRSMLDLYLNPPGLPKNSKYTLPLLVCGSPLYDPQSPGWFRVAYKDIMPQDEHGVPQVNVMQAGSFKVFPDSERETPYLISNHMIAAGVTGKCTNDPSRIPDIRKYEAQDLVSATFLKLYAENPDISPEEAKAQACQRWFGNPDGSGAPIPKDENDRLTICALAQMDLFFEPNPPRPKYTFDQAITRCKEANELGNPCCKSIGPDDK